MSVHTLPKNKIQIKASCQKGNSEHRLPREILILRDYVSGLSGEDHALLCKFLKSKMSFCLSLLLLSIRGMENKGWLQHHRTEIPHVVETAKVSETN